LKDAEPASSRSFAGVEGIQFSEALAAEGAVVFAKACKLGLEGIMSKRRAASIRAGEAAIG
jgi:ATP-dependent DNA ligase